MKLTIDRKTWRRGGYSHYQTDGPTHLLNSKGKMCCLGFASIACGLKPEDIELAAVPATVANNSRVPLYPDHVRTTVTFPECMAFLVLKHGDVATDNVRYENSSIAGSLMAINDDEGITETVREERLQKTFATVGWDVEFIN